MFLIRGLARQITRAVSGVRSPESYLISDWKINPTVVYHQSFQFSVVLASDNLCLVMTKSRPSGNLLFQVPETYEIQELMPIPENLNVSEIDISYPAVFNCIDWLIEGGRCFKNYLEPFDSTRTFKYEKLVSLTHKISEDLFCPLRLPEIFGQCFSQAPKQQNNLSDGNESVVRHNQNKGKIPSRSLNQWDLLQPVLLPPLSLEFPKELDFYRELRGYQKQGISWLVNQPSALLADEMGTGKTVQTVNALRLLFRQGKICSALIVCPPAVIGSINLTVETGSSEGWSGHFYHWATAELDVVIIRGGSQDQRKLAWERPSHVYITTYDTLRTDIQKQVLTDRNKFDCIILDEAQKIKNRETKTSQAIRLMQPKYRWALTGTPIENSVDDIKSLFDFIRPGTFKNGIDCSLEEIKELIDPYMLRRLKQDVLQDLPDKVRQEDWLELDEHQKEDYNRALQAGRQKIETSLDAEQTTQIQQHIFALLAELKQICNFAKDQSESPKTALLLEYIEVIAANKKKVLVFSQYRKEGTDKIANFLDSKGIQYVLYTGTSDQKKNRALSDFRSNPDITVFLATIQTAGYGITLTEATYVIHFDHPWNPAKMQNAEDRTHRIGQKSGVTVYSFWMKETVEARIKKKLVEKRLLVESTIDELAVEAIESGISTEDWLDIFDIKPTERKTQVKAKPSDTPESKVRTEKKPRAKVSPLRPSVPTSSQSTKQTTESTQMSNDRLRTVEENLELLRKQIAGREKAKILAPFEEHTRMELVIQELRKQMRPFEEEYWQILVVRSKQVEIAAPEAEMVVAELVEQVGQLQTSDQYPDEVLQILQKIYIEVSKPGMPAAAKL